MTGRTHDLAAFTALSLTIILLPLHKATFATGIVAIVANMVGGIAPDIDQPTAPFWRNLPVGGYVGRALTRLLGGHRFLSHSVIGIAIFGAGWHYLLQFLRPSIPSIDIEIVWWTFMIGFVSHLVMDTFTHEGVPWLLPVPVKFGLPPFKLFRIQTGGIMEKFILFPALIIFNGYLYFSNYSKFLDLFKNNLK